MKNLFPGITKTELLTGLGVKVLLGLAYGWIFLHYYHGDDTWAIHKASVYETGILLSRPGAFFRNEFTPLHSIEVGRNLIDIIRLYINDLEYALLVKTLAIANLVTRGNYYLNSMLFNILVFYGHYWLFLSVNNLFPGNRKLFFAGVFLFLPAVFWLSGIRGEGMILLFFSLLFHGMVRQRSLRAVIAITTGFCGVMIFRPQLGLLLTIPLAGYWLSNRFGKPVRTFALLYVVAIVVFFASARIFPGGGLPGAVLHKQEEFFLYKGTAFHLDKLTPNIKGFAAVLPQALQHTFLRPWPWEARGLLQGLAAAEVALFWLLVALTILYRADNWKRRLTHPAVLLMLSFAFSVYLFTGYIVPFPGAIIRYKCLPELLIVLSMIALIKPGGIKYANL